MTEPDPAGLDDRLAAVESQLAELRGELTTASTTASMTAHALDTLETQLGELATTPPAPAQQAGAPEAASAPANSSASSSAASSGQQPRRPLTLPELHIWVGDVLLPMRQPLVKTGRAQPTGLRWCPQWHRHPEAVARLRAMAESHRAMRAEIAEAGPGHTEAVWFRDICDPLWRELTADHGPFAACSPSSHSDPPQLTHTDLDEHSAPLPELDATATARPREFSVWWLPPQLLGDDEPDGSWSIAEQTDCDDPPVYGDGLADGPRDVSQQWLAEHIAAATSAAVDDVRLAHEDDELVTTGGGEQITAPRYTATLNSP